MYYVVASLISEELSQGARFVLAGLFNTGVSYGVYALGLWLGLSYPLANFLAMLAGVLTGFITQGRFVFRRPEPRRFPLFVLTWLLLWGLNILMISLLLSAVNGNAYVAGAISMIVVVALSFIVQKYLVFADRSDR